MHLSSGTPSEPAPLTLLADEELVRLARMRRTPKEREGATRAFQVLHQRYESQIFRYLVHQVQNTENAQDLTQETFLKAWKGLPGMWGGNHVRAWLFHIAINETKLYRRRQKYKELLSLKPQHYMSPLRKVLLLPVPFCLALVGSSLCVQLGQLAGFWLLGALCALLVYPVISVPLVLRLLLPIRFRPLLTLKQKLVGVPALLVTASCAGASWFSLTAQSGTHLDRWEVEGWCGLISTTCLVLACL